jgi:hypothetical protein
MKRSEINALIRESEAFFAEQHFALPPFASWTPEEWATKGHEADEIRENALGWDLTDFGSGDFGAFGLVLFTVRNGDVDDPAQKKYAEKLMISGDEQMTPWHFHWAKTEDIINRGGGRFICELAWASGDEAELSDRPVEVSCDGVVKKVEPKGRIVLKPGESITLVPKLYHRFWGEGKVLVGEVSSVNDDSSDNRFLKPVGRFPEVDEDEPPYRHLCNEYPAAGA